VLVPGRERVDLALLERPLDPAEVGEGAPDDPLLLAVVSGALDLEAISAAPTETVIARLTELRGLGRWTADWFLARCLGRGDICPAGDLAVRKAFDHYYGRGRALSEKAIRRRGDAWGHYQNLAVHYLLAGMRLAQPAVGGGT